MDYLIAIDNDGTLKPSNGSISLRSKKIIKKLVDDKNYVVICTARPRYYTENVAKEVNASEYIISSNGAEIYNTKTNSIFYIKTISKENCLGIYQYAKEENLRLIFVVGNNEYVTHYTRNDNQILLQDNMIDNFLSQNEIKQCMITGKEKSQINEFKKHLSKNIHINIVDSYDFNNKEIWFSVTEKTVSKGHALKKLSSYLNIPTQNIIAIGNDFNDISMFKVAGKSAAVNNAPEKIKEHANIIIESNDDDGVAKFLEML